MGVALAKVYRYDTAELKVEEIYCTPQERKNNEEALWKIVLQTRRELNGLCSALQDEEQARIIETHVQILEDEELFQQVLEMVENGARVDYAIATVFERYMLWFRESNEEMLMDKIQDLKDIKEYLLRVYYGEAQKELANIQEEVILVAKELLPSEVPQINTDYVKGIILEKGGMFSHAAILARMRQIPIITGAKNICDLVKDGMMLGMNSKSGKYIVNPSKAKWEQFVEEDVSFSMAQWEGVLKQSVAIGINIDSPKWSTPSELYDFVGLYRTEVQYVQTRKMLDEEELFEAYKQAVENAKGKVITFRTLDFSRDKTNWYIHRFFKKAKHIRGIRFCLEQPEIFLLQLRALLRASAYGPIQIMFPMVENVMHIQGAIECLEKAKGQLKEANREYAKDIPVGTMVETLGIINEIEQAVKLVDFASVGTNDLMEEISGISREEAGANMYEDSLVWVLFEQLEGVFTAFKRDGKPITVCGEMAGNPKYARRFVELGATGLSMNEDNIAGVKAGLHRSVTEEI